MTENVSHDLLRCRRWLMNSPSSVAWHCYCVFGDWGDLVFGLKVGWNIFYLINRTALKVFFIKACAIIYLNCFCPTLCNLHQRCHVVLTPRCLHLLSADRMRVVKDCRAACIIERSSTRSLHQRAEEERHGATDTFTECRACTRLGLMAAAVPSE